VRILAAVDVHDRAESMLDRIVPWAQRLGATVDLCYASQWSTEGLPRPPDPGDELDLLWGEWAKRADAERTQLEALTKRLPDGVRGAARLLAGPPTDVLSDAAQGYDLVCVVTHQRTGLSRLVNGSVSARVVRSSAVPVLVLGYEDPVPDPGDALYVLAPVDGHESGALPWIAKHLPLHRTEMLHVRTEGAPVWVPGPPRTVFAPKPSDTLRAEIAELAKAAGFPGMPLHLSEREANAGDGIARVARELGVDLIVLPTHGRRGVTRLMLGSVAERVVERAHCAVLVVPWAAHATG
jgi:nucleotide-binding universal stress UspA family protein